MKSCPPSVSPRRHFYPPPSPSTSARRMNEKFSPQLAGLAFSSQRKGRRGVCTSRRGGEASSEGRNNRGKPSGSRGKRTRTHSSQRGEDKVGNAENFVKCSLHYLSPSTMTLVALAPEHGHDDRSSRNLHLKFSIPYISDTSTIACFQLPSGIRQIR